MKTDGAKTPKLPETFKEVVGSTDILHGAFVSDGTFVAFPLCFPGASAPIPIDESAVTALALGPDHFIYGGTSGRRAHFFVGMFRGATGAIFDMGVIPRATECTAVVCRSEYVVACGNDAESGRMVRRKPQRPPFDLLQEWGFVRSPLQPVAGPDGPVPGERILHAVGLHDGRTVLGITPHCLFSCEVASGRTSIIGEIPGRGRLVIAGDGVLGADDPPFLWLYDGRKLHRRAIRLPHEKADWTLTPAYWAYDRTAGVAVTASDDGCIVIRRDGSTEAETLARAPLQPVGPLAVVPDGRLFGTAGEGIGNFFRCDLRTGEVQNLGVAVSVLQQRRYGYQFGSAVTGPDGEIYWGESDNLGHLWIYFPALRACRA